MFLDLDNFKTLNDTLGHDVGDLLLQQVARRLTECVREGDTVARLGGDEFVIILENLSEQAIEAATLTEVITNKMLTALNAPYQLGLLPYNNTPSIGITLFEGHTQAVEELLKQADIAMYQSKKKGRNHISFFDPKMQASVNDRVAMESALHIALTEKQFCLYYQPQTDQDGRVIGAEALIRWYQPQRGDYISPTDFIPLAEETGLILAIGQWVLESACELLNHWKDNELTRDLELAVNVSARQFHQAYFVDSVKSALRDYAVNPRLLKLELTESMLLDNVEETITIMMALKEIGVQFSLDDFGTGYSSLQYLRRLPINQLKIDQSFVRDIAVDNSSKVIVRTIIAMAQTLNLNVIAEGVETEEQKQLLLESGCRFYQGYLFGKPLPRESLESLIVPF